jgi:adenylate cyclase
MRKNFQYTTLAHRYTARFPVLTYVSIQTNFWIVVNMVLVAIMHLQSKIMGEAFGLPMEFRFGPILLIAIILGVINGTSLGVAGYYLDRKIFRRLSLGKVIIFKALGSLALLIFLLLLLRFVLYDLFILPSLPLPGITWNDQAWDYLFSLLLIYYFFMTLVISFINQINKKYGPGVLIPLLLGRYRTPREEERIFMFMDLKSSTATAEKLGHLRYSAFIRDCFMDINEVLLPFHAQVYQYVGDEIVVTWPEQEGVKNQFCIKFYFACRQQFSSRAEYYIEKYGLLPEFKAGMHAGLVTAVEIGELKREIAYHGDTLNTAARIQSVCNEYEKNFLVSEYLFNRIDSLPQVKPEALGMMLLKGKTQAVGIVSLEWIEIR